ncbi:MAG: hypothetical protein WC413_03115 [Candidatus Nanoarchaeia archaeon]
MENKSLKNPDSQLKENNPNKEMSILKNKLSDLNDKKEFWFKKKEDLKKDINVLIVDIKKIKLHSDESNKNVEIMKKERDKYNHQVKSLLDQLSKLHKEKTKIFYKYQIKDDPYKIQKRIEAIEKRLETETSFENEKKLMKQLNALKAIFKESKIRELIDKIDKIEKQVRESKKKAQEFHNSIVNTLKDTNGYASFIGLSRKINDLRSEQEAAFAKFIEYKQEFLKVNEQLKQKLNQSKSVYEVIQKKKKEEAIKHEISMKEKLKEKTQHVLEKFRKKKRLDTNDLLVLQGMDKKE